jgi:CubicO group peptidase (beta-lactamase class C family)
MNRLLIILIAFLSSSFITERKNIQELPELHSYLQSFQNHNISIAVITPEMEKIFTYSAAGSEKTTSLHSVYEIGSITKTFTSTILAQKQLEEKLSINDTLCSFLPAGLKNNVTSRVTLKELSTHSSGLPRLATNFWETVNDPANPYSNYTEKELELYLENCNECSLPGSYSYSNLGAGILGNILCENENKSYQDLLASVICEPLKMHHTTIDNSNINLLDGYDKQTKIKHWDFHDATAGQGAARSTIGDMLHYLRFNLKPDTTLTLGKAVQLAQQEHFRDPVTGQRMGLGWHMGYFNEHDYYEHTGGTGGFRSFIGFIPGTGVGVVILSNSTSDVSSIGIELLKHYQSKKV